MCFFFFFASFPSCSYCARCLVQRFFFFPTIVLLSYTRVFFLFFLMFKQKKNMCVGSFSFVFVFIIIILTYIKSSSSSQPVYCLFVWMYINTNKRKKKTFFRYIIMNTNESINTEREKANLLCLIK